MSIGYRALMLCALLGGTLLLDAAPAWAVHENAPKESPYMKYPGWTRPLDEATADIAFTAGDALGRHLTQAQKLLRSKDEVAAVRSELLIAAQFVAAIEPVMPYSILDDQLRNLSRQLRSGEAQNPFDQFLPVYASLDALEWYAPEATSHMRERIRQAALTAKSGRPGAAAERVEQVRAEASDIIAHLPVHDIGVKIRLAQQALDRDPPDRSGALAAIKHALADLKTAFPQRGYAEVHPEEH
jgi:hypothetical protein